MSKTVDERVVKMTFDNQNFDPKVNASMNTIDKLKSKNQAKNQNEITVESLKKRLYLLKN